MCSGHIKSLTSIFYINIYNIYILVSYLSEINWLKQKDMETSVRLCIVKGKQLNVETQVERLTISSYRLQAILASAACTAQS